MQNTSYSIRTILIIIVALTTILAVASSVISTGIHQDLIYSSHRTVLSRLIKVESFRLLEDLKGISEDLGLALQSTASFRRALKENDKKELTALLSNQFHQYFVTADVIRLEQIALYDDNFSGKVEADEGTVPILGKGGEICRDLYDRIKYRKGPERHVIVSGICHYKEKPLYAVVVPVGGLRLKGFLVVVTNPEHALRSVESYLGIPVRIKTSDGKTVYESNSWPESLNDIFLSDYSLTTQGGDRVLTIAIAKNNSELHDAVSRARIVVLIVSFAGVMLIVTFGAWLLKKTTLVPLRELARKIELLHTDREAMGECVDSSGVREVSTLISGFNEMSKEMRNLYDSLEYMAYTDALTKLPNRNQFQDGLLRYVSLYKNTNKKFTIFLMDLDRFKGVNDTLGHNVGDLLLKSIGQRLQEILRVDDIVSRLDKNFYENDGELVARLGGDEFAALFPDIYDIESAAILARKLIRAFDEPFDINDHSLTVGLSIGIAIYPEHGGDMHTLISHADVAMYYAKSRKCGFSIYESKQNSNSLLNLKLEQDLFAAIRKNELVLHYQPKISLTSREVTGLEALVRWQHPKYGIIMPDNFIQLAEQTGLIQPLTEWVLNKALSDLVILMRENKAITVSVNLSAQNLRDNRIAKTIASALKRHSIPPANLVLELTESMIMTDPEYSIGVLNVLSDMQINIAIDDFGTGHSSLSYIKNLPVHELKIDKSFIQHLSDKGDDEAIVRSVLVLAQHMGLTVTAEGVENREALEILHQLGCDSAQGYYFARPMSLPLYLEWCQDYQERKGADPAYSFLS